MVDQAQVERVKPKPKGASTRPPRTKPVAANPEGSKLGDLAIVAGSNANPEKWKDSDAISASTARNRAKAMGWDSASETLDKFWGDRGWVRQGKSNKATWHKDCS